MRWDWLWLILGMQGSIVGVQGAEQTWFISSILLCYLATPIFAKCCAENYSRNITKGVLSVMPVILALAAPAYVSTVYVPICWYGLAYFIGSEATRIQLCTKGAFCAFLTMCSAFGVRLIARMMVDGTILYDRIVVSYTQVIAAFAMFYIVAYLAIEKPVGCCVRWLGAISFEVYLYHYMFCVGPVRLFSLAGNWLIDCCIVTIITVSIASIMKIVSDKIAKGIQK